MSDAELLSAYAKDRSADAFAELVRRHLDWVHSAALRQVRDPGLAQGVTQAVFILLANRAKQLQRRTGGLAGWLFITTRHVAGQGLRAQARPAPT